MTGGRVARGKGGGAREAKVGEEDGDIRNYGRQRAGRVVRKNLGWGGGGVAEGGGGMSKG